MNLPRLTVDRSRSPSTFTFEAGFNVAAPFIDRHVPEGRGPKIAIRCQPATLPTRSSPRT